MGGGPMRTAAKIAGIGVYRSGLRGSAAALPTEQSVRNASSRQSSIVGVSSQGVDVPRVVSVPTVEQAKEATTELKDAIDQVYLSHESSQYSSPSGKVSVLSPLIGPVNRSSVTGAISNPSVPTRAIQAFHLLSSSLEVQDAVAKLVCDPKLFKVAMENPAVISFLQSQQTVADFGVVETDEEVEKLSSRASVVAETPEKMEETTESHSGNPFFGFKGFRENVKRKVTELGSRVSSYLQNIFPTPDTPKDKPSSDADGNTKASFMDRVSGYLQYIFPTPDTPKDKPSSDADGNTNSDADGNTKASFMVETLIGLALLVIMVIVGKR